MRCRESVQLISGRFRFHQSPSGSTIRLQPHPQMKLRMTSEKPIRAPRPLSAVLSPQGCPRSGSNTGPTENRSFLISGVVCRALPFSDPLPWQAQQTSHCNERHSFHARVGRFSPFLYLRSVAIAVISFWLRLVVLVSPCFLGSRISRDYRFPPAPLFLCSERKPSSLTTGSSKL